MSEYTYKEIKEKAKACVDSVEKNNKLGINTRWSYYFAKALLAPKKNVKKIKFDKAPKPKGTKINRLITKKQYLDLAEDLVKFVESPKKRLPNYLTCNHVKIRTRLYVLILAKALAGNQPDSVRANSTVFKSPKKYGRSTKTGCDNRGQNTGYYCGPHMVQEIIRNLTGIVVPQKTLAQVIGTTTQGSDHEGLNTAFAWFNKKYGYNLEVTWKHFSELGWNGINSILESSNQDCGIHEKYRETWGHYTNYDKLHDSIVDVHNSLGDKCSGTCYCGYSEKRSKAEAKKYIDLISQKSVMIVTMK